MIADTVARKVFAKRGNHSEAHISELELAAIINTALLHYEWLAAQLESDASQSAKPSGTEVESSTVEAKQS